MKRHRQRLFGAGLCFALVTVSLPATTTGGVPQNDPADPIAGRPQTMVATQGLFMLNDELVMDAAEATARRLLADDKNNEPAELVNRLFESVLGAEATDEERDELQVYFQETLAKRTAEGAEDAKVRAWAMICQALFASSRFRILE